MFPIAYGDVQTGNLWRSRADGSEKLQLSAQFVVSLPRWSLDGTRLAFTMSDAENRDQLYVISRDGGTPQRFDVSEFDPIRPTWLPEGNSIVLQDSNGTKSVSVKVVDLSSSKVTILPGSGNAMFPVCSPDGHYVSASTIDGQKLMLFDFQKQQWSDLVKMNVGIYRLVQRRQIHLFRHRLERRSCPIPHSSCRPKT